LKQQKKDVCPGCGRHCTRDHIRCRRGREYFAEKHEAGAKRTPEEKDLRKKRKWEKYVTEGGLAWKLIFVSRTARKALCREKITEEQLASVLDEQEKAALVRILDKLGERLK